MRSRCTSFRRPRIKEDANGNQLNLSDRIDKRQQKQMQHMHCRNEFCKCLKYILSSTEETTLPVLTDFSQEIQIDISGKLHPKHVSGEPYVVIRIDR